MSAAACMLLAACAVPPEPAPAPLTWRIEPVYRVTASRFADAAAYRALARRYELEARHDEAQQARRQAARLLRAARRVDGSTAPSDGLEAPAP